MKSKVLSCLLFVVSLSYGQNLVPNPSFEDTISLNMSNAYLEDCITDWKGGFGYFNTDRDPITHNYSVPYNILGYEEPKTGNAYSGIFTYTYCTCIVRNYIQCELKATLINTKKYVVSYWVSLADTFRIANNSIGALFTPDSFNVSNNGVGFIINQIPQTQNNVNNNLTSKTGWTLVTDTFMANGTERWITIGNFLTDSMSNSIIIDSTCTLNGLNCGAYYYIDDVSVELLDETGSPTNLPQREAFRLSPNPATSVVYIDGKQSFTGIVIFNAQGCLVEKISTKPTVNYQLSIANYKKGVYFVKVTTENSMQCLKLVVQ